MLLLLNIQNPQKNFHFYLCDFHSCISFLFYLKIKMEGGAKKRCAPGSRKGKDGKCHKKSPRNAFRGGAYLSILGTKDELIGLDEFGNRLKVTHENDSRGGLLLIIYRRYGKDIDDSHFHFVGSIIDKYSENNGLNLIYFEVEDSTDFMISVIGFNRYKGPMELKNIMFDLINKKA